WVKVAMTFVFLRNRNWIGRPAQAELWIIVADAALMLWCIEFVDEIEGLRIFLEREEPVRKALRRVYHAAIVGCEYGTKALAKGGRINAQIENDIIKRAADAPNQLGFSLGR